MIQPSPPDPPFTCIWCTLSSIFYIIYLIYFSSWNCLGPCVFFSHIKIQKSHIKKTHNCCESIKRELKQKSWFSEANEFIGKCTVQQCFTLQPGVSPQSLSSTERVMCESGRVQGRRSPTVYKINPSSSPVLFKGAPMGGGNEKSHRTMFRNSSLCRFQSFKRKKIFLFFFLHL